MNVCFYGGDVLVQGCIRIVVLTAIRGTVVVFEAFSTLSQIHEMCGSWYLYHLADIKWNIQKASKLSQAKQEGVRSWHKEKTSGFMPGKFWDLFPAT